MGLDASLLREHINEKNLIVHSKDITINVFIAVHYLQEISKVLNQNQLKQFSYFQFNNIDYNINLEKKEGTEKN